MSTITLMSSSRAEVTSLSNRFIDTYMPRANGEFVKVYIYLLRVLTDANAAVSTEQMADCLLCTEKDISRALNYWEKEKLMTLTYTQDHKLAGIVLLQPDAPVSIQDTVAPAAEASPESRPQKPSAKRLTPDRVKELKQDENIIQLLYIAEQYLGKTLSPTDMQKILFFYDELKMSADLIEYLIEYCVSRSHKSMRYIETVAFAWKEEGITTVQMAKDASARFSKDYYTILKAMGITGRNPVDTEIALIDTWRRDYGFGMEIIQEACSRTVLQTGQPSFQYADKILSGWKSKQVRNISDIHLLDAEHKKRKLEKSVRRNQDTPAPKNTNRFNNFHQREYDFEEYEKRLLNQ